MLNRLQQIRHKPLRVLRRGEMSQALHRLMLSPRDLVRRFLRHFGRVGPVVLPCEHVHGACVGVDRSDARAAVPASEVEVEIAVKDLEASERLIRQNPVE